MDFRTRVEISAPGYNISHCDKILMLGSCFSENVGERLARMMFDVDINPFGTLYNPESISVALGRLMDGALFSESELFQSNGMWHSFSHHSRFSSADKEKALRLINGRFSEAASALRQIKHLVVTFGSAWVFRLAETGKTVANCHKLPASCFHRRLLNVEEIFASWETTVKRLVSLNPSVRILFTVSPIRHLADGLHGNRISKSTLLLAVERIVASCPQHACYFPSYEIVLDELRDYRFYAADMLHPSEVAVDYIMERFSDTFFLPETKRAAASCEKLQRMLQHRAMTDNVEEIEKFGAATRRYADELKQQMPYLESILTKKNI